MRLSTRKLRPAALLAGLALILLPATAVLACKYSVRDVGFVDLDASRYRLVLCDQKDSDPARLEALRKAAEPLLTDTNISLEVVREDQSPEYPVFEFLHTRKRGVFPAAVLVAPEGRQLEIPLTDVPADSKLGELADSLKQLVTSPAREQILERALSAHSIVLLLEGSDPENNQRARFMVEEAVKTVHRSMDSLPKPVGGPPEIVVVSADQSIKERVLLWSLGISREDPSVAHLVVIFGRGRLTGSPLAVPGGTATELVARLEYVGRDCECELDRSWMQGAMIPHRWDLSLQVESTQKLGFDPDSPLVKYDMGRILARGTKNKRQNLNIGNVPAGDPVFGYTEMILPDVSKLPAKQVGNNPAGESEELSSAVSATDAVVAPTPPTDADSPIRTPSASQSDADSGMSPLQTALVALGTLGLLALAGGGVILLRSRRS